MTRRIAAVVFILVLTPALLCAQETVFTVGVQLAAVHKGPSTGTPIVGLASRGTALPVANNLGSWVKVPWPDAPDGVGYVHVTMGKIDLPGARPTTTSTTTTSSRLSPAAATGATTMPAAGAATMPPAPLPSRPLPSEPTARRGGVSRVVGIGGLVGSPRSIGATARVWGNKHLGVQFGFTRETMTSDVAAGRVTSMQFEPGVMFVPVDRLTDYVWFRPYVGSVVSLRRQTLSLGAPEGPNASDSAVGLRVFGGSELRFSSLPQFALSVELGYRRFPGQFAGFEADPVTASIAGHWYIK
jgi:hypothetical protein